MSELNIQQNATKSNDEIDIFEFCSRIWRTFSKLFSKLWAFAMYLIIITIRKTLWITSFALLGIIMGVAFSALKKTYYVSMLEGTSGGVDNTVVIDHINKLDQMVAKPEVLASYLGFSVEEAKQVRYVRAFYGIDVNRDGKPDFIDEHKKFNPRDTTQQRTPSVFYIKVALYDEDIMPKLRESLLKYINDNVFIQNLFEIDQRQKQEMIDQLEKELAKLDTIHLIALNQRASIEVGQRVFVMGSEPEIRLFYQDILDLYNRKQSMQRSREISDRPVIIVQDFTPSQFIEKGLMYYVIRFGIVMAIFGFFCSLAWQYRKTIWKLIIEDQT